MGYYDTEAPRYDESRGGTRRARAAAEALAGLLPDGGRVLDLGGGTGIVSAALARLGHDALVADLSHGMLRLAVQRLPGRVLRADAGRLPLASCSVDAVTAVWLLHLLPPVAADRVLAEVARVLRPGGRFVSTVDKAAAHGREARSDADARARVTRVLAGHGLVPTGETTFRGPSVWGSATAGDPEFTLLAFTAR